MRSRPFGYFVHHQGRGHAERCAAIVNALPEDRPVTIFCARTDIFPDLPARVRVLRIPSLFEPEDEPSPPALDEVETPETLHCAPLGWRTIRQAVATLTGWFASENPALFVVDVSAELAQLARIASVPAVKIVQHGDRSDPGHQAAYRASAGLLAPWHEALADPAMPDWMRGKMHFAGGLGVSVALPGKAEARRTLGLEPDRRLVVTVAGAGGEGLVTTPLSMAARLDPETRYAVIGRTAQAWHETPPGNLDCRGWVSNPQDWIAAADVVISSTGNTTVQMVATAGRPWLVIPEWRYYDEQGDKARRLAAIHAAHLCETWPASPAQWRAALDGARAVDLDAQRSLTGGDAAAGTAEWLEGLSERLWTLPRTRPTLVEAAE